MNELNPDIYTVAWIAPLEIEAQAALHMLDNHHRGRFALNRGDDYVFRAGDLGGHNTVIATLPAGQEYGTGSAAALASQVKKFFPNLWFGLLVGVAAGLPSLSRHPPRDIRLGDVLVGLPEGNSAGLIAYDLGKDTGAGGFQLLRDGHVLANTETVVRSAIQNIKLMAPQDVDTFRPYYESIRRKQHANGDFNDPGQDHDHLYQMDDRGVSHMVQRERRPDSARTRVWYGPIGSGEKLMKNTRRRNELRDKYGIIGLEMEAAGTMNRIPVGVIRGVCDYGDEHKNKGWQSYAAAMAAAYAKAILYEIRPKASAPAYVKRETDDQGIQSRLPVRTTFLGRDEELSHMKHCFGSELCRKSLVLWGLSGSGKTQLAIHYVTSNKQTYQSVLWIDGSTSALIHQSFENLSHHISGYNRDRPATEQVIEWLERETNRSWMMIFDGVPGAYDVDDPENFDIRKYLPACDHGHILLVTTASDLHLRLALSEIHLEGVDDRTGSSILLRCAGVQAPDDSGKRTARSISRKLGGLPLALEQAGTLLSYGIIRMDDFNRQFQQHFSNKTLKTPMKKYVGSYEKGRTLWTVFEMSYDGLMQRSPDAIKLLHLAIFLSPGCIPSIFGNGSKSEVPTNSAFESPVYGAGPAEVHPLGLLCWLNELRAELEKFAAAVNELELSGFVTLCRNQSDTSIEGLAVHALIRAFVCSKAPEEEVQESLVTAFLLGGKTLGYGTNDFQLTGLWKHTGELRRLLDVLLSSVSASFFQDPGGKYFALCGAVAPVYAYTSRFLGDLDRSSNLWDIAIKYRLITDMRWPGSQLHMDEIFEAASIGVKTGNFEKGIERYELFLAHCDHIFPGNHERAIQAAAALREAREISRKHEENFGRAVVAQRAEKRRPGTLASGEVTSSLQEATESGDMEEVKLLLENGASIDAHDDEGLTPLHIASLYRHAGIVHFLLQSKAEINPTDNGDSTPLHLASKHGCLEEALLLLEHGAEVELQNIRGETALICAAQSGHVDNVQCLLDHGARLDIQDISGSTALSWASGRGKNQAVDALLRHVFKSNLQDDSGMTALVDAVFRKEEKHAWLIAKHGADPNIQDSQGLCALSWAVSSGLNDTASVLLRNGADPNLQSDSGQTPLMRAALLQENAAMTLLLIKHGADPNIQDKKGFFALFWASHYALNNTALILLGNGADPNLQNDKGQTSLMRAAMLHDDAAMTSLLIQYGADPNIQDEDGYFALYWATFCCGLNTTLTLLENGADPNLQNGKGETALMRTALSGCDAAIILLLKANARIDIEDKQGLTAKFWAAENQGVLRLLSEGASSLDVQDRKQRIAESAPIPVQEDREQLHQPKDDDEQQKQPKEMSGVLRGMREQHREATRTMGKAWNRFTKRPWKGKSRMERIIDYRFDLADDDSDVNSTCNNPNYNLLPIED